VFGWIKESRGSGQVEAAEPRSGEAAFAQALVAYNLIRQPKLLAVQL